MKTSYDFDEKFFFKGKLSFTFSLFLNCAGIM